METPLYKSEVIYPIENHEADTLKVERPVEAAIDLVDPFTFTEENNYFFNTKKAFAPVQKFVWF